MRRVETDFFFLFFLLVPLFTEAVWVGKGATLARLDIKGRGRAGIVRPSSLRIVLPSLSRPTHHVLRLSSSQKHHRSARMYFNVIHGKTYQDRVRFPSPVAYFPRRVC